MNRPPLTLLLGLLAVVVLPLSGQDSRSELLVEPSWLLENREMEGLVVLHVAADEEAVETVETIPGARLLHLGEISYSSDTEGGPRIRLDLPAEIGEVVARFEAAGISDDSRVVVAYDGGRFPNASRTVWTLQALGFDDNVSILHGGIEGWVDAGGELTAERPEVVPGRIEGPLALDRRVDAGYVLERGEADGVALVDARRLVSWDGTRPELPGRVGHIPGAGSLPQTELYDEAGRLKPEGELRSLFEMAGYEEGDELVAYCHIGYWASAVVFAARTLGIDARLYDGSMTEWAADSELPLILPPADER